MKMLVYAVKEEEIPIFEKYRDQYDIEITLIQEDPSLVNARLTRGMDCISVLSNTVLTEELWDLYYKNGVRYGVTRTIGMEHMNKPYAESLGIKIYNITYSPASVADYAIMMMLMLLRNVKTIMKRWDGQDYTVDGVTGRELPNMTVGIIGAGNIGTTVARHISGFGCRILYWNRQPKEEIGKYARYCELSQLLGESDIVTLHIAANQDTYHFMNQDRLMQMKKGSVLINTARGELVDNKALIRALEEGQVSAAGLDVVEGDRTINYKDHKNQMLLHHERAILDSMPNVLLLPHAAYLTDQAIDDMVRNSLEVMKAINM